MLLPKFFLTASPFLLSQFHMEYRHSGQVPGRLQVPISSKALKSESRRKNVLQIRAQLIKKLVEDHELSFAETVCHLAQI